MDQEAPGSMETSNDTGCHTVPFAPYKPRRLLTIDNWKPGLSTLLAFLLSALGVLLTPASGFIAAMASYRPLTDLLPDAILPAQSFWAWFFSMFHSSEFLDVLRNTIEIMVISYIRLFLLIFTIVSLVLLLINALHNYWTQRSTPLSEALARMTRSLINAKIVDATLLLTPLPSVFAIFPYSIEENFLWLPIGYLIIYIGSLFATLLIRRKKRLRSA